jgi:molybdopterin synthase sulfur carrier subunit
MGDRRGAPVTVSVRYWAAARAAAGLAEESYEASDLAQLLGLVVERHNPGPLAGVLARCSYLVNEVSPGTRPQSAVGLDEDAVVDVLPPFAGG